MQSEPLDLFYGKEQTRRYRVATQAGPGVSSASFVWDSVTGERFIGDKTFNTRREAVILANQLNDEAENVLQ